MTVDRTALLTELRRTARLAELRQGRESKKASTGRDILYSILDERAFIKLYRKMEKSDEQSAGLLRDITEQLATTLTISAGEQEALRRIRSCVENGERWDEGLLRNNIFKAGNSMGIRLPSAMFASKTANEDATWFKGEVNKALQILRDACDVADRRGGLSDENGTVAKAVTSIRGAISKDISALVKSIK